MLYKIYTDGGSRGNPGPGAIGVVIFDEKLKLLHKFGKTIGEATNNIAEYRAVQEALLWIKDREPFVNTQGKQTTENREQITINFFLDSLLVASQLAGTYKIKEPKLKQVFGQIQFLIASLSASVSFSQIPREKNHLADAEVNNALDKEIYG